MEFGSGLAMFKEKVIWCLSRIVEDVAMQTGLRYRQTHK